MDPSGSDVAFVLVSSNINEPYRMSFLQYESTYSSP